MPCIPRPHELHQVAFEHEIGICMSTVAFSSNPNKTEETMRRELAGEFSAAYGRAGEESLSGLPIK